MRYYGAVVNLVVQAENNVQAEVDVRVQLDALLARNAIRTYFVESVEVADDYVTDD